MSHIHPEILRYLNGESTGVMCKVFLFCGEPAVTTIWSPALGDVPACASCAAKVAEVEALSAADKAEV